MSTTAASTSLKCRMFLGTSITMPAMPMVISVKASRRAESDGSQEVTTVNANQNSVTIKTGRTRSRKPAAAGEWRPGREHHEQQRIADLVGEIADFGDHWRIGQALERPERNPQQQKHGGEEKVRKSVSASMARPIAGLLAGIRSSCDTTMFLARLGRRYGCGCSGLSAPVRTAPRIFRASGPSCEMNRSTAPSLRPSALATSTM